MSRARLILDADGVFLDESPYWTAALLTALLVSEVDWHGDALSRLDEAAFVRARLQHVTKLRGCNSNWDLAAVLAKAADRADRDGRLTSLIAAGAFSSAAGALQHQADALWKEHGGADGGDPLAGFGLERNGEFMEQVIATYQDVFHDVLWSDLWPDGRYRLKHTLEETLKAFVECAAAGYELHVCTGRLREEIMEPLRQFRLDGFIERRVVDDGTIVEAEKATGKHGLAKPHWFSVFCAATDFDAAVKAVRGIASPGPHEPAIYVGDGLSDFECVRGCVERGLPLRYIHVESPAGNVALADRVRAAPYALAVVPSLLHVPDWIRGAS